MSKQVTMEADDIYFLRLLLGAFAEKTRAGNPFTQTDAANCRDAADELEKMLRRQLTQAEFFQMLGRVGEQMVSLEETGKAVEFLRGNS